MLLQWALIAIALILTCELLFRTPLLKTALSISGYAGRATSVIARDRVSDHWKERVLPAYAGRMLAASLLTMFWTLVVFSPFILIILLAPLSGWPELAKRLYRWESIVGLTVGGVAYAWARLTLWPTGARSERRAPEDDSSDYTASDRLLHAIALDDGLRSRALFQIERRIAKVESAKLVQRHHVFVTGLARAGTTILMRELHATQAFSSLTYRDMPFVMSPNVWSKLSGNKASKIEKKERAHGDGIMVDLESAEALEEPFWRLYCGADYIKVDRLVAHDVDPKTIEYYRSFVGHVLRRYGGTRYLAKNNNNILRLPALRRAFPKATILVPFRHPLTHAASLRGQHRRFCADKDPFTKSYMGWLAHHEFGPGHRPFAWNDRLPAGEPSDLNYWLDEWVMTYREIAALLESPSLSIKPLGYEQLCEPGSPIWRDITQYLEIPETSPGFVAVQRPQGDLEADEELLREAVLIYDRLSDAADFKS